MTELESPHYLKMLNDKQREATLITEGPLIVLAGAGSGKTRMLTSRIAYLVDVNRVPAHQILAVTFTNKAAGEMRERIAHSLGMNASFNPFQSFNRLPEVGTFHSICIRILRREVERLPFQKNFTIYDDSDQATLIKSVMAKLGVSDKTFSAKAFQAAINRAKCDALEPHELEIASHSPFQRQLERVYELYQKDLFAAQALDFGEMICLTYRLLRDHEDVRSKYQRLYRYLHVDEYQDTNRAQYLLLSMLASAANGGHQNICVVGDEDQSIYKWRGADIRNILDFEKDYPGAAVVKLEQNYRSTRTIISAAGSVIRHNTTRKPKTLWTANEEGVPIIRAQLADERGESELVVSEIKRLAREEGFGLDDFAIFYRTHAQSRQFEEILRREKVAYHIVGGLRFYDRKEVKDILSYFKLVYNPADNVSLKRIINVPARGIGKGSVEKLEDYAGLHGLALWEVLKKVGNDDTMGDVLGLNTRVKKKLMEFCDLILRLREEQPKLLLSEFYHKVLDETAYVVELRKEGTIEALARIENLEEFDTLLLEFEEELFHGVGEAEARGHYSELLRVFLERSSLLSEEDKSLDISSVKMMTLHSSKGLEFPVVFMVGMEEGLFPSIRAEDGDYEAEVEEERRLCYVGMTRARKQLFMSHVVSRRIWGVMQYHDASRFFSEIPTDLMRVIDLSFSRRQAPDLYD